MGVLKILIMVCLVKAALSGYSMQPFQKYCPSSSIHCDVEDTVGGNTTNVVECCGSCSCDRNCGQTLSCCLEEDNVEYTRQHGKECVEPFVGDRHIVSDVEIRGIMMVTHCLDRNVHCKNINGQINIQPVEGKHFEIFLNKNCAKCNNVIEFTRWNIKIRLTTKVFGLNSFRNLGAINSNSEEPRGTLTFLPTSTSKPISCDKYSFRSINYSSCPNESYAELCASVRLPYSLNSAASRIDFRNVFCYLCENPDILPCYLGDDKTAPGSFSMILDQTISTDAVGTYLSRNQVDAETCDAMFLPHPNKVLFMLCFSV